MAKSKARFLSELLGSTGLVKKSKSALAGADEVLDLDVIPSIPNSKLTNSNISIAGHSTALGASVTLNTGDIGEHTNYKYYTDARVRSAVSVSGDLAYNSSTGVFSFTERTDAEVRGLVSATGSLSYNSSTGVMSFTMPAQNTSNITEGSNLYFTNARADARITNAGSGNWNTAYGWGNHASGGYAPLASPTLTGTPAAPTAAGSTSTTQLATTAFVQQEITTLIGGAPSTLNDLNELAAAINDDANYNSTLTTALATKLPKAGGTMTGGLAGTTASFSGAITAPSIRASSGAFYINRGSDGTQAIRVDADGVVVIPTNYFYVSASQGSYFSSAVRFRGTISNDTGTNVTFGQPISVSGNIVVSGTVDGRDVATDGAKLDGIAASANNYSLPFTNNSSNWNTAYGWGNHASGGYAPASTTITTSATQGSALYIRNSSPTIYLRDTDHLSSMIHQNSNVFYVLRSNSNDATGWTAHDGTSGTVSGQWPLSINITNASNSFSIGSPNVSAAGHTVFHAGNSTQFTSAMNTKLSGIATSANNYSLPSTVLHSNAYKMTGSGFKLGFHSGGGGGTFGANHYSMGKDNANGSWSSPHYSDLIIGYHTGIRIGAAYTGIRFYNNSPTSDTNNTGNGNGSEDLLMTIGGHAGGSGVIVNNALTVGDNLYLGDGNDGYFYSDSNGRTAFAGGDFYIQSSVGNYYNYATNQYIGDSSGDNIYFRGNTLSGNAWTLTGAGTFTTSGVIDVNGGHGGLNITNSSILSSATSSWTGNPGGAGKIQYHSNRWYIVSDSSSNRIVQFRRDGADKSYIANDGKFVGTATNADTATNAGLLDGLDLHTGRNNEQNKVVRTNSSGYADFGWINTLSGATSATLNRIYCSEDGYIRYQTPANFGTSISPHINFTTIANNKILPTSGNYQWSASTAASGYSPVGISTSFVRSADGWPAYGAVLHVGARGGSDAGGDFQIYCGHGSANGGNYLRFRNADNSASPTDAWTGWKTIWASGNDGSGSGLDADLLDGLDSSAFARLGGSNHARTYPNRWFATADADNNIDFYDQNHAKVHMGVTGKYTTSRAAITSDQNYWVGSMGWGQVDLNTIMSYGSGFWDSWSSPANRPSTYTSHWNGFNSMHYTASSTYHHGMQMAMGAGNPAHTYLRGWWANGGSGYGWQKIYTDGNDGSGSGLDADFLDGVDSASFLRSDTADTFTGTLTMGTQQALVANNYGHGVFGLYSATRYQHVWSMGTAYKTNSSGTSYGNMYGLTYTHTNIGTGTNQAISGLSHQLQHRQNGVLNCAFGAGIWTSGNVTAYSDIAVKTNLVKIPNALEKVCSINGYTYERTDYVKDLEDPEAPDVLRQAGVVAQEVEKVLPEVVSGKEGNKAVAYGNIVALLIESIKELKDEVDELKKQLKEK